MTEKQAGTRQDHEERRQELLERAVRKALRHLEEIANHYEKSGETEKAEEVRTLLAKLRSNIRKRKRQR